MSVDIFVARHGQNEDNANDIIGGHRDLPLTDLGRQQALNLAHAILDAGLTFDVVYSSPLSRAYETAEIISEVAHLPSPQIMDDLIERDFGGMSGKPVSAIKTLPTDQIMETDTITYFFNPDGGETFEEALIRAHKVLENINEQHEGKRVLLVCHGDIGKMIYAAAVRMTWRDALISFHFGNAELIDVSGNGDVHTIKFEQFNH